MVDKNIVKNDYVLNSLTMAVLAVNNMYENDKKEDSKFYHHL